MSQIAIGRPAQNNAGNPTRAATAVCPTRSGADQLGRALEWETSPDGSRVAEGREALNDGLAGWLERIHTGLTLREAKALLAELHPERRAGTRPAKLIARLRRFSAWVRAECGDWLLAEQALVQQRLRNLAAEIGTPAAIATYQALKPLGENSLVDSGQTNSTSML